MKKEKKIYWRWESNPRPLALCIGSRLRFIEFQRRSKKRKFEGAFYMGAFSYRRRLRYALKTVQRARGRFPSLIIFFPFSNFFNFFCFIDGFLTLLSLLLIILPFFQPFCRFFFFVEKRLKKWRKG